MRLWIIRHAKSSWAEPMQSDFERGLNKRGHADGERMSSWLAEQSNRPTWLWTSDAARALATAEYVKQGFGLRADQVHATRELYHAGPEEIVEVLQQTGKEHGSVALVAHNPGLTYLVNLLVGQNVTDNLPTFGTAELRFANASTKEWMDLRLPTSNATTACADLVQLQRPKALS